MECARLVPIIVLFCVMSSVGVGAPNDQAGAPSDVRAERRTPILNGVKLLEYELDENGESFQGEYGKYVRHPFSGVSLAEECGVPAPVLHIIAAHAAEGNLIKRSTEAYIVHHADFMTFLPFKERLVV